MPQQAAKTQNVIHLPCLPLLFVAYPFKGSSAVSCISWRRIPGQKQKDAAQIYFFYQLTEAHRNGQKQAAGRAHPPPVSGSRQRATSCISGRRITGKGTESGLAFFHKHTETRHRPRAFSPLFIPDHSQDCYQMRRQAEGKADRKRKSCAAILRQ